MAPWLQVLEAWAVQQLLRTPGFHRLAERAARNVHRFQHGLPREQSGTELDNGQSGQFMRHFTDELKSQLGQAERQNSATPGTKSTSAKQQTAEEPEGAHEAWEHIKRDIGHGHSRNQGFMADYVDALKEQLPSNKPRR